ncbi:chemotaxis protein CheX [Alicyclobacillus curvatus]|nr:chemotaxis protein CheX [Alicyclobacillus curvatus]
MSIVPAVTHFLNSALNAVSLVIPSEVKRQSAPTLVEGSFIQSDMGVLIGITGELPGRLILDAHTTTFSNVAQLMYGMALEGEMLESFVGEIGNMVAGNAASDLSSKGLQINISPPTVLVGSTKITGFEQGIQIPLEIEGLGPMNVFLIMEGRGA